MEDLFQKIQTAGFHGSLAILLFSPLIKKGPKKYLCMLSAKPIEKSLDFFLGSPGFSVSLIPENEGFLKQISHHAGIHGSLLKVRQSPGNGATRAVFSGASG